MATVTKKYTRMALNMSGSPYGNLSVLPYKLETNSSGVCVDSDQATAIINTNVVRMGRLPAGAFLYDSIMTVIGATNGSVTGKLGFEYVDGVDDSAVPEDDDFFNAAKSLASIAMFRKDVGTKPVKLPKEAWLILTIGGADINEASEIEVDIICELKGPNQ
jgi:hypothetical protein